MAAILPSVDDVVPGADSLTAEQRELAEMLLSCGQEQLFADWSPAGEDEAEKAAFWQQVAALQDNYDGGIPAYIGKARGLLAASAAGDNPLAGFSAKVPAGERLEYGSERFMEMESLGLEDVRHCAFVFVAGGLGERLGFSGIKLALPSETSTETCFLSLYARNLLAYEAAAGGDVCIPLAIMTSGDTHDRTVELLEANDYFGLQREQVTLMKQGKVPALADADCRLATSGPYQLQSKPHGHGDVHFLLHRTGLAAKWAEEGRKWVVFMQDTNGVGFAALPAAIGVSRALSLACNSMTIPRAPKQAVGAIVLLSHEDPTRTMTCNVEYNQLDPLLRASGYADGDVADDSGLSPFPGNCNQLIFELTTYVRVLAETAGVMPEFVNPKYKDDTRTAFKKPTRLECMMQDYPKVLTPEDAVGFTSLLPWCCFSPVKNELAAAAGLSAKGIPTASAPEAESDMYQAACLAMRAAGVAIGEPDSVVLGGVTVKDWPHIVIDPRTATSQSDFRRLFPSPDAVTIAPGSTLIVSGKVVISSLRLSGTAVITGPSEGDALVVDGADIDNAGWKFVDLADGDEAEEWVAIRGYKLVKHEQQVISA